MRRIWLWLFVLLFPLAVLAQSVAEISQEVDDDRGFLTRFLEKNLSGAGRVVHIEGFRGALSSRATFERITIADADGIWLTLNDGAIQWNRSALLRRRIEIAELSAAQILLPRPPLPEETAVQSETTEFALPELPVGVNVQHIAADRVELGAPVIGIPAVIQLDGNMRLDGGEGETVLNITRLDGPQGRFVLDAGYANETRHLRVNLDLDEAADGLLANLVNLHDKPSVTARIGGEGALDDFAATIDLATDGQPRVTGSVGITAQPDSGGESGTAFRLDLGGDVASLLPPSDRAFFGADTRLRAEGWRAESGRLEVPVLSVATEALAIDGELAMNERGAPERAQLLVTLGSDAGAAQVPVGLPFAGEDATVESGRLQLQYDAAQGQGWTLSGRVGGLDQGAVRIGELTLDGGGEVVLVDDRLDEVTGRIGFGGTELSFADENLAAAIGDAITGETQLAFAPGNAIELSDLKVDGADYGLAGYFLISGLSGGVTLSLDVSAQYEDLARLSGLAGRPVTGRADADLNGYYVLLSKSFDIDAEVVGSDISVDQPQLDRLLAGQSTIRLDARRDEAGIEIADLSVDAERLQADASGFLNSAASDIRARITMPSLSDADDDLAGALETTARLTGAAGQRRLSVDGEATDLRVGVTELDGALQGVTRLGLVAAESGDGFALESFSLANPQLNATGQGSFASGAINADAEFAMPDLAVLGRGWSGDVAATAQISETDGTRQVRLEAEGTEIRLGQQSVDGALTGLTRLQLQAEERGGVITVQDAHLRNDQMDVTAQGTHGDGVTDITASAMIRSLAAFGAGWRGSLNADASLREAGDGQRRLEITGIGQDLALGQAQVDGALAGETRLAIRGTERDGVLTIDEAQLENARLGASARGQVGGGVTDLSAQIDARDLRFLGSGISGALSATAQVQEQAGVRTITANGSANGLALGQATVDPLLRGLTGFDIAARQSPAGISIQRLNVSNPQLQVSADGDPAAGLNVNARLADLALIRPEFPGPVVVTGTMREAGANFVLDLDATAPGNSRIAAEGSIARDFSTSDLTISGNTEASVANPFLRTRSIAGPLTMDLRMSGPPGLQALTGQVRLAGGEVADPGAGIRMEGVDVTADFQGGRIAVDGQGRFSAGGRLAISGPVDLNAGTMDISVTLDNATLRDPNLYETVVWGNLRLAGPTAGGALLSGQIDVGETEFRIPSTGLGGAKDIPDIRHVGDTRPVRATRAKAGLEGYLTEAGRDAGMAAPASTPSANPIRLDLLINAPQRIFIRGRGVDTEMGGSLQVQGTVRNVIPIGHLELIRGRIDLLGKRFVLSEGLVELQGSMIPVIRLVAETQQDGITTRIIIDGEIRDPDISFESSPELPEEEVLSQLLFGRGLDSISPLQAAQLANAIAVLAGTGGVGIVGSLRDQFGLDDLDLATDSEGNVQLRAGKYLSENLYTDVSVGNDGTSTINLNLDITETLRARGSVGSDGESTLGIYFERDY